MKRKLLYLLIIFLAIAGMSLVSAVSLNGIDFNAPDGFKETNVPNGMDNMLHIKDSKAFTDEKTGNWIMIESGDKLVDIPSGKITESKNMTINNKQGTYNTFSDTHDKKVCHFFDYEQNNKKVRVITFSDDDGLSLLKEIIK